MDTSINIIRALIDAPHCTGLDEDTLADFLCFNYRKARTKNVTHYRQFVFIMP